MIQKIAEGIFKINVNSNLYLIQGDKPIIIDTGDRQYQSEVRLSLGEFVDISKIKTILFTHLHYDHIGNIDLFPNAKFYAHPQAIKSYKENSFNTIMHDDLFARFGIKLEPFPKDLPLKVIHTPGHTKGSVCFYLKEKKIMFTGDTLFFGNNVGRTDLPTSVPEKLQESLTHLMEYDIEKYCPGHDY